ncbi:mammalian cell entry protein [Mycolicibacterium fluoranthenivorans]|jgi:Mce-associated membrane protein|uniref:Mammalian cell entry protein n=1 Tax=Mycolicibacterium fluoranthenivorans TaxID=258505 RepID=A0A1G4VJ42_9MYCO|nr:mammalian cell entry protein [Mycolicibacterium fluoranthenivorans]QNJ92761.1 mammalian cell entry protein [Mycolicibacterium fluoranthenivorans]SCX07548.1 Mce-associated membrane protein [Mycolicibacterium fluoranthenivorans]
MVEEQASADKPKPVRRRASRAAGPAGGEPGHTPNAMVSAPVPVSAGKPMGAVVLPRRQPNRGRVLLVSAVAAVLAAAALVSVVLVLLTQYRHAEATTARQQRFVDTAEQTVLNMFSYNQNTIDESVNRFVDGTSGPLRDMLSQGKNVDNLKAIFRDTQASSEAVVSGAALEKVDEIGGNAAVLVAVRVTVTDIDGVNKPSQAYRMRVIVHEDDNGHMTGYDLKYPEGGN